MKNCELMKRVNLKQNELLNFEKSHNAQKASSLNSSYNNPYSLWRKTDLKHIQKMKKASENKVKAS